MGMASSKHPLLGRKAIVIAGPTAVGKSALALKLCERLQGELISVDSVQVYRELNIGANKPSPTEIARVPHHLLNIRDPSEEYTAGAFYRDALTAVEDVLSRNKVPVLVGGTSMYMRWLARGRPEAPKADPIIVDEVRGLLAPLEAAGDWAGGLAQLEELDPERATQLSKNDWYRLERALTVAKQTNTTVGSLPPPEDTDGLDELRAALDLRCFFLCAPREPLCRRIDERCEAMLTKGLLEETCEQLLTGSLLPSSPAGRAIGYRQALQYLTRSGWKKSDSAAFNDFALDFAAVSRRYAAQQTKWFRSEPTFEWVPANWDAPETTEERVFRSVECSRDAFDVALTSGEQRALRLADPKLDKAMKLYIPKMASVDEGSEALLERADACRERLEPKLEELLVADEEMAKRFPWERKAKGEDNGGGGEASASAEKRAREEEA